MPTGSIRVSQPLTNISVQYKNKEYIAGQILEDFPVKHESDQYWIYTSDFRIPQTLRANKSVAKMETWSASTSTYYVNEHALKDVVSDRDRANAVAPLELERDATEYLTDKILLRQEYEVMKLLFTTTTFSYTETLNTATSFNYNTTTSAPIQKILTGTAYVLGHSGIEPNIGVTNRAVFDSLRENPNVYGRIQYVERAIMTKELLAAVFDIDSLYVGKAIYDTNREGAAESLTAIWPADFLLMYKNPRTSLRAVTSALNFRMMGWGSPYRVKKWRDEEIEGDYIEVQTMFKPSAIATQTAYLIKSANLS
jgi:hypothetical protein